MRAMIASMSSLLFVLGMLPAEASPSLSSLNSGFGCMPEALHIPLTKSVDSLVAAERMLEAAPVMKIRGDEWHILVDRRHDLVLESRTNAGGAITLAFVMGLSSEFPNVPNIDLSKVHSRLGVAPGT